MIHRVFSSSLDPNKNWYALNTSICGIVPRRFCSNDVFKFFEDEIASRQITELRDENGEPISPKLFNAGYHVAGNKVFVGTSFAVVAGNIRQRKFGESEFLRSNAFAKVKEAVNKETFELHVQGTTSSDNRTSDKIDSSFSKMSFDFDSLSESSVVQSPNDLESGDELSFTIGKRKIPPKIE
jgi:hypothetical protein